MSHLALMLMEGHPDKRVHAEAQDGGNKKAGG